jgi:hypothetical protein
VLIPGLEREEEFSAAAKGPASFVALMPGQAGTRRRLTAVGAVLAVLVLALILALSGGGGLPPLPRAGVLPPSRADPLGYNPNRVAQFVARATAGEAHPLFVMTPGGAVATAARVDRFTGLIDRATSGTSVAPSTLAGIVFLESAGEPQIIAGGNPANAAGLTQIVAATGQSLLEMKINLSASQSLSTQINQAQARGQTARVTRLEQRRAQVDPRFDPRQELAGTVRYLELAEQALGRPDLALESYHMGIGNLKNVLADYDGGTPVPYAQLYFDSAPDHHASAYQLLSSFGDDSWTYYWRILAAEQIMELYRTDRAVLNRLATLQVQTGSAAEVLHPPRSTPGFATPGDLDRAYASHAIEPLPADPSRLGLAYSPGMGALAHHFGFSGALYRGLRPAALDLLVWLASRVRQLSGAAPLTVASTVSDERAQQYYGYSDPPAAAGWSFNIERRYVNSAQRSAFQAVLDRLQSLNLIAWQRYPAQIEVTVASDVGQVLARGV